MHATTEDVSRVSDTKRVGSTQCRDGLQEEVVLNPRLWERDLKKEIK